MISEDPSKSSLSSLFPDSLKESCLDRFSNKDGTCGLRARFGRNLDACGGVIMIPGCGEAGTFDFGEQRSRLSQGLSVDSRNVLLSVKLRSNGRRSVQADCEVFFDMF